MSFLMGFAEGLSESLDEGLQKNLAEEKQRMQNLIDRGVVQNDEEVAAYEAKYQENKKAVDGLIAKLDGNVDQVRYYVEKYGIDEASNLIGKMYEGQINGGRAATEYIKLSKAGDTPTTADHIARLSSYEFAPRGISPTLGKGEAPTFSLLGRDDDYAANYVRQGIMGSSRKSRFKTSIDDIPVAAQEIVAFKPYKLGMLADPAAEADRLERIAFNMLSKDNITPADKNEAYSISAEAKTARALATIQQNRKPLTNAEIRSLAQDFAGDIASINGLGGAYDANGTYVLPKEAVDAAAALLETSKSIASDAAMAAREGVPFEQIMYTINRAIITNKPIIFEPAVDAFSSPTLRVLEDSEEMLFTPPAGVAITTPSSAAQQQAPSASNTRVQSLVGQYYDPNTSQTKQNQILTELTALLGSLSAAKQALGI